jgi:hypothetical protein
MSTVIVISAAEALAQYRLGKEIDYRLDNDGPWIANPLSDAGNKVVSVVDAALGAKVRFRVRPPVGLCEAFVRDFGRKGMDGDTYLKIAELSVRRALDDVRVYMSKNHSLTGREFIDDIERKYTGTPGVPVTPKKVEAGSRWKIFDSSTCVDGSLVTVEDPAAEPEGLVKFRSQRPAGSWLHHRFLTEGRDRKDWEHERPRFEYVGPAL